MHLAHRCPKCAGYNTVHVPPRSPEEAVYDMLLVRRYGCMTCNWPFRELALKVHLVKASRLPRPSADRGSAN